MNKKKEEDAVEQKKQEQESKEEIKEEAKKPETKEEEKLQELTDTLQHLQAEFENYKKRVDKENCEFIKCANEDLIKSLLPIIDNFELALKSCRDKDDFYRGMELIYSQLIDALHSQGLKHINCFGKKFDPYYHEVLLTEESSKADNTITEELQKGYLLNDKVIRHSKVKIAKKKKEQKEELSPRPAHEGA
ncbi:nucleotide exchange factor GrpE [Candidatus Woesearchaeota archaeon]|nr:nucleotide exchange factor GrpE [Candidatus Woesearchaeota archaeon]